MGQSLMAMVLTGAALFAVPVAAQEDSPSTLTPDVLQQVLECRGSMGDLMSYADMLFSDHPPTWLERVSGNGHPGMLALWTYKLAQPIKVFGHETDTVSFMKDWVVTEMPRADALPIIERNEMERAPIALSEQYFHFVDDEAGPMLGAFAPIDDALARLLGAPAPSDTQSQTLFVGCNYAPVSKAEFLDLAKQADAIARKSAGDIRRMFEE